MKCEHKNKAYSLAGITLTSYPPIHISYWICKDCGEKGSDSVSETIDTEYNDTVRRFENSSPLQKEKKVI